MLIIAGLGPVCRSDTEPELLTFFEKNIGLSADQIKAISNGNAVAKALPPRSASEVFLFGTVRINAAAESYLEFARDFNRLRSLPTYLALAVVSNPPRLSDFEGFSLGNDEITDLRHCKPGSCQIQVPGDFMEHFQQSIDWSAPNADELANRQIQKDALQFVVAYQNKGNAALGDYQDKRDLTEVSKQFTYLLSYYDVFPERLPDLFHYLLSYPDRKPAHTEDVFYWAKVKFGLKPTLRLVHMVAVTDRSGDIPILAIAEKQLYSSHYFETALDLTFCIPASEKPNGLGFYLVKIAGSEQAGLTGVKGSLVRNVAVGRSVSSLQKSLMAIRNSLETDAEHRRLGLASSGNK